MLCSSVSHLTSQFLSSLCFSIVYVLLWKVVTLAFTVRHQGNLRQDQDANIGVRMINTLYWCDADRNFKRMFIHSKENMTKQVI
jgi:hypothetical protein